MITGIFQFHTLQAAILLQDDKQIAAINEILESSKVEPWNYGSSLNCQDSIGTMILWRCYRYRRIIVGRCRNRLLKKREKLVKDLLPEYGNPPRAQNEVC